MALTLTDSKGPGWNALEKAFSKPQGAHVAIGVLGSLASAINGDMTNVDLAELHEFGSPGGLIPERSFIRAAIDTHRADILELIDKLAAQVIDGKMDEQRALGLLGAKVRAWVQNFISSGQVTPPDAPSTVAAKGSDLVLVDTGQLLNSISWEVREGVTE